MSWQSRLLSFGQKSLAEQARLLIDHQSLQWPALADGLTGLAHVKTRILAAPHCASGWAVVQCNPARIRSTAARVDAASVGERKCFLCPENLPPEESAIAWDRDFVIACNPYPVLDRHLSIIHRRHVPQRIDGRASVLLELARDLSPDYFALYNGPECGASAPDHLHFQACSRAAMPMLQEMGNASTSDRAQLPFPGGEPQTARTNSTQAGRSPFEPALVALTTFGRSVVILRGQELLALTRQVEEAIAKLSPVTGGTIEPMLNVICTHDAGEWVVLIFPRSRHRPACFSAEGEDRMIVSPGAIDMGGVVVTPYEKDFERMNPALLDAIYREVSVPLDSCRRALGI